MALLLPAVSFAATKSKSTLSNYVLNVSKLTNKKYVMEKTLKGDLKLSRNFKLTKENADSFISRALFLNGYTD